MFYNFINEKNFILIKIILHLYNDDMNIIYNQYLKSILSSDTLGNKTDLNKVFSSCSISLYNNVKK